MLPPRSVLAAVDFSEPSRVALSFAVRLAKHCRAALHVVHVENPLLAAAAKTAGIDLTRETGEELARFARSVMAADSPPVQFHIAAGDATHGIDEVAAREHVDAVVVGMHGMSGAGRAMFGSTTEGVLRHADRPVLVIPASWTPPRPGSGDLSGMGPLLVAIENEQDAPSNVEAACHLAKMLGTSVSAIHVVPELSVLQRWQEHARAATDERTTREREAMAAALSEVGHCAPIPLQIERGHVAERLAEAAAASGGHSLLILGRHDRARRRGAPGATAYRVLALAQVPVLVYHHEDPS